MSKGFASIYLLIGILIIALIVPIPEYKEVPLACPQVYGQAAQCTSKKVWVMGKPLLWRVISNLTTQPPVQTNLLIATPTPQLTQTPDETANPDPIK